MKIKNVVIMLSLVSLSALGTELDIVNGTEWTMDVVPVVSLAGRVSDGKAFTNIAHNSGIKYNSGIYKIIGLKVRLRKMVPNGKGYNLFVGETQNWPSIEVTNRNAYFVLDTNMVGWFYFNKTNMKDPIFAMINWSPMQFVKTETKTGWTLIED